MGEIGHSENLLRAKTWHFVGTANYQSITPILHIQLSPKITDLLHLLIGTFPEDLSTTALLELATSLFYKKPNTLCNC